MRALGALICLAVALLTPGSARAWTEANVSSVSADVDVDASGHAQVTLLLTVRIGGGWLSGLDLDGLDPDLVLDEAKPPWAMSADDPTQTWTPTVRVREEGGVRLGFGGRGSPRRGTLLVGLSYATELAGRGTTPIDDGQVRVSWTLPGWRAGLDNVEVKIATPEGAEVAPSMEDGSEAADDISEEERPGHSVHVFRRIHLPRTMPWTVSVDLPAEALDPALRGPTVALPHTPEARSEPVEGPVAGLAMILLVAFLSLASRASFASACRARDLRPRPLVAGPFWLILPAIAALVALGQRFVLAEPAVTVATLVAIAAAAIQRAPRARAALPALGGGPLGREALAIAKRERFAAHLIGTPLLDLTTLGGAALFFAAVAAALTLGDELGHTPSALSLAAVGLSTIPFLTATRFHLTRGRAERLLLLRRLAEEWREAGPIALRLSEGPTLSLIPAEEVDGLLRFEVVITERAVLGGFDAEPVVLLSTAAESEAEARLLRGQIPSPIPDGEGRLVRIVPAHPARIAELAELLSAPAQESPASLLAAA